MNIRTAKKILKFKEQLKYTKNQVAKAETIQKHNEKNIQASLKAEETSGKKKKKKK